MRRRSPFTFCTYLVPILLFACNRAPADDYTRALVDARAAKDEMLRTAGDSPIPPGRRQAILPLAYFPANPAYRVPATLSPDPDSGRTVQMLTSSGQLRATQVMGVLEFVLQGQRLRLRAFVEEGSNGTRLFVPFTDATSGHETYGAGRYVDLDRTATGIYVLDFNTAYNPYCAYNPAYECPVPPKENRLQVAVRAGEMMPRRH